MLLKWRMLSSYWDGCQTDSKVHSETLLVSECAVIQNFAARIFHVRKKFDKNGYCGRSWLRNYNILAHLLNGSMLWIFFKSMSGFGRENKNTECCGVFTEGLSPAFLNVISHVGRYLCRAVLVTVTCLHTSCVTDRVRTLGWLLSPI